MIDFSFFELMEGMIVAFAFAACMLGVYNLRQIRNVHLDINSRLTELLRATHAKAFLEGREQQRKDSELS